MQSNPFENLKNKRIALIGGAGFIGHNLALSLRQKGADVHVVDGLQVNNLLYYASDTNPSIHRHLYTHYIYERLDLFRKAEIPLYIQDVRDYTNMCHLLNRIKPDVLVHLAAVAHADRSNKDPYSTFDHSARTLENMLDYARGVVEHFVFFSSSMVYGHFTEGIVNEETPCEPLGIYGALKFSGEKLVIAYKQVFDLDYTIIRPSALYGERCVSRRVAQIFVENAIKGQDIIVHGDGQDKLDFTYIQDLIQGVERVIAMPAARNQVFNLTYGQSRSIGELAEIIAHYFPDIQVIYKPKDQLMPDRGTLSVEKARTILHYAPEFPLEKGMERYIDWYRSQEGV
jgi:nucleoside-diphosphate-sugar epimerase